MSANDFLIHVARLQDAGVTHLTIRLGLADDAERVMFVSPLPIDKRWPEREFAACGTDRLLESIKDDIAYGDAADAPAKMQRALDAHPLIADDLRVWWAGWLLMPKDDESGIEVSAEEEASIAAAADRAARYAKGLLRGIDIAREQAARVKEPPKLSPRAAWPFPGDAERDA